VERQDGIGRFSCSSGDQAVATMRGHMACGLDCRPEQKEYPAMEEYDVPALAELSDTDLDLVAGGRSQSLVNISLPVNIVVGVQISNQINTAVLSIANQANTVIQQLTQTA
jgi:hypothetical protein